MKKNIVFYITSHGFGHFAQLAPIMNSLVQTNPEIAITIVSAVDERLITSRMNVPYQRQNRATDFGMRMFSAFKVDVEKSFRDYCEFHRNWDERVAQEKKYLAELNPSLIIVNAPYLPLAAAAELAIPSMSICSLNWADIATPYFSGLDGAEELIATMIDSYRNAVLTMCPQPSMAMPNFTNVQMIGPIAAVGKRNRELLCQYLGVGEEEKILAIVPGGIYTAMPLNQWQSRDGFHYIVTWDEQIDRKDFHLQKNIPMRFADIMCSCDAVVTKPGYGMVAETACNGVPVLYAPRGDWPEEPFLVDWWKKNACCVEITHQQFINGEFQKEFIELQYKNKLLPPVASGVADAVSIIQQQLNK